MRLRCDIEHADAILCFDASLLEGRLLLEKSPKLQAENVAACA